MTKQKAAILEIIRSGKCHYTAEEIFNLVKKVLPGISRATVYNNLHALEGDKSIRRITGEDASDRYDSSYVPHGHLFCTSCGSVQDFTVPDFLDELQRVLDTGIDSYELKVRYVCPSCKRNLSDSE